MISDEQNPAGMRAGPNGAGMDDCSSTLLNEQVKMISRHVRVRLSIPVS